MQASVTPTMVRVNAIATRSYGIVTNRELIGLGMAQQTISSWARGGRIHRLHAGVFSVVPPSMTTVEGRWMAAVKAAGAGAALCNESAAQLDWLIPRDLDVGIHVLVPDRCRRRIPGVTIHRPRSIAKGDFRTRRGIRTTTIERTLWDLAYSAKPALVRDAFELADGHDRLNRALLARRLREHPHRRGSKLIAALLAEGSVPLVTVRSWLEELFGRICGRHGLPHPAINVPLLGYEVDFLWEGAKFVVEADGGQHMKRTQRDADNARDIALQRAGYIVRRYSSRDMNREDAVAAEVLEILTERLGLTPLATPPLV